MTQTSSLLRMFGMLLRDARERAGLTQEELGQKVSYSRGQIGMVETAQRRMKESTVREVDEILSAQGVLLQVWREAATEVAVARIADLVAFERRANLIREYNAVVPPGMLQTEGYMRGLFSAGLLSGGDENGIEAEVQQRRDRQELLTRPDGPRYSAVLYEGAIRGIVQDVETTAEQLAHLKELSRHRRITIQVIPFSSAKYAAVAPLIIMDAGSQTLVHMEPAISTGFTTTDPTTIEEAREQFDLLRSQALPTDQSIALIDARMEELR